MSKKKRKPRRRATVAGVPLTATPSSRPKSRRGRQRAARRVGDGATRPGHGGGGGGAGGVRPSLAVAAAANTDGARRRQAESIHPTANYRIFSLYRKDSDAPPPAEGTRCLATTFCMAPEDILIRNSFHMLSETEKVRRRNSAQFSAISDFGALGALREIL